MDKINNDEDTVIRLLIKAPDQQIHDQIINCQLYWNVGQLKEHLHEVYPSKPKKEDQKIIYSGQMLVDSMILKDVFNQNYNLEEELFIVHLVCPSKSSGASTSGLQMSSSKPISDKRNSNDNVNNSQSLSSSTSTTSSITSPLTSSSIHINPPGIQMSPIQQYYAQLNTQQLAWMQQAYAQYLNQYMQLMASQGIQLQSVPYAQPSNLNTSNILNPRDSINPSSSSASTPSIVNPSTPVSNSNVGVGSQNQIRTQQDNNEVNGRNNNINNNNNNNNNINNNNAGEDNEAALNRDWLDVFDVFARVVVLSSIVYFYSSPSRFLIVTFLGFVIYLIQGGFFRGQQVYLTDNNGRAENNNNVNINNNNVNNDNGGVQENNVNNQGNEPVAGLLDQQPQLRQRLNVQQSSNTTNTNNSTNTNETNNNQETRTINQNDDNERPGALAFTWTFFSSFFASLIPEQPHVL